MTIVVADVC